MRCLFLYERERERGGACVLSVCVCVCARARVKLYNVFNARTLMFLMRLVYNVSRSTVTITLRLRNSISLY